jgi:hypothetical protein
MKRLSRAVAVVVAAMMVMALAVAASHSTWVSFDPASPVLEGTVVTASANSDPADTAPKLELWVCRVADESVPTVPAAYASFETCNTANDGSVVWVLLAEQGAASAGAIDKLDATFNTSGLGGQTTGFKSHRDPGPNSSHPSASGFANLVINAQPTNGAEHPGCKGVENAYSKVSTNNGSSKGKGGEALEKVAAKLGCDLAQ